MALVALFAAVGLITATGAFTTVEAERTADVEVAGDADAFLGLDAGSSNLIEGGDTGEIQITLDGDSDADGLNLNATTYADGTSFLNVTNNGQQDITFNVSASTNDNVGVYFVIDEESPFDGSSATDIASDAGLSSTSSATSYDPTSLYSIGDNGGITISSGNTQEVGMVIVTEGEGDLSDEEQIFTDGTVTFTAESQSS